MATPGISQSEAVGQANPRGPRVRMAAVMVALLVAFVVVAARLVQIQVLQASTYREIARRQYEAKVVLPATRGLLYDRNGKLLVSNTMFVSFGADPKLIRGDADDIAGRFARVFGKARETYRARLDTPEKRFVWLERRARPATAKRINPAAFDGVIQMNEPQRLYHYDDVAGQVIGFTDIDNNGLGGLELELDPVLKGANGFVVMQRDGLGRKRPTVDYPRTEPVNGNDVVLTLDIEYQAIAEEELERGVERSKADGGLVIMMDPATGEILAMANYPRVNPANPSSVPTGILKNRAITDMFEPGSVFKVVTAAAALERNAAKPEQKFFAEHGTYVVPLGGGKTRTITDTHPLGTITFQEAVELSSNIVLAKISDRIGAEALYTTARNFGFGTATGIELPGEVSGELKKPTEWSGTTLNTMAYGYEVAVTPLQIAEAYCVVANGGILMKPSIVKEVFDEHHESVDRTEMQRVRRVISQATARTLTRFFEGVVERGTGVAARLAGLRVAGKTGTSRKFIEGRYATGSYTASFVGFFPADDPKVVCLVMLDNPHAGGYTGGLASAPVFRTIAEKVFATSGRFSRNTTVAGMAERQSAVPDVRSVTADVARGILGAAGLDARIHGTGSVVLTQTPAPGTLVKRGQTIMLDMNGGDAAPAEGYTVVPDIRRLPLRRALNRLNMQQLEAAVTGSGIVVTQSPAAGQQVRIGARVAVTCEPKALPSVALY